MSKISMVEAPKPGIPEVCLSSFPVIWFEMFEIVDLLRREKTTGGVVYMSFRREKCSDYNLTHWKLAK